MKVQFSNVPVSLDALLPQNAQMFEKEVVRSCGIESADTSSIELIKKSVDARKKSNVHFVVTVVVDLPDVVNLEKLHIKPERGVSFKEYVEPSKLAPPDLSQIACSDGYGRPVIVGAGPAGLFCALYLARAGLRPIVIERGKKAPERMKDIKTFSSGGALDPNSNVQFGEGGAGTFSDGKLGTGIKSPHIRHVLQEFVSAGAPEDILVEAKPHIGTDELVEVVQNLRASIEAAGGEFRFSTVMEDIVMDGASPQRASAVKVRDLHEDDDGALQIIPASAVVLAIGHSARDTFAMLENLGMAMERKPFAVGVRIEHLQRDLDRSQYGKFAGHPALGPANYKLAAHDASGRGVYTFCMCPGGQVVAASSEEGGVCVNGMSEHARDGVNGNSAVLVEVRPDDLPGTDVQAGVKLQRQIEQAAFKLGTSKGNAPYTAPVQTVGAFFKGEDGKPSEKVVPTYPIGINWTNLRECLPGFVSESIAWALPEFGQKLDAFLDEQAVLTGVEARSSSPIRMIRDRETMCSTFAEGLYPCGEGAGYAGGIMSAAVDGIRVAEAICARA